MGIREHLSRKSLDLNTEWNGEKLAAGVVPAETYKPINDDPANELRKDAAIADKAKLAARRDEVTFIKTEQQNADANIDLNCVVTPSTEEKIFETISKEDLLKYANDPFWVRLRWICFIAFWLIWLAMLIGAVMIVADTPKCAIPDPLPWYKRGLFARFDTLSTDTIKDDLITTKSLHATGAVYVLPEHWIYDVHDVEITAKIRSVLLAYEDSGAAIILDVMLNNGTLDSEQVKNDSYVRNGLQHLVDAGVRGIRLQTDENDDIAALLHEYMMSSADAFILVLQKNSANTRNESDKTVRARLESMLQAAAGQETQLQWELSDVYEDEELHLPSSALLLFVSLLPGVPIVPVADVGFAAFKNVSEHTYKHIARLRSTTSYMHGVYKIYESRELLAYSRSIYGNPGYFVISNPSGVKQWANFSDIDLPHKMTVDAVSENFVTTGGAGVRSKVTIDALELSPYSTILLTYVPVKH